MRGPAFGIGYRGGMPTIENEAQSYRMRRDRRASTPCLRPPPLQATPRFASKTAFLSGHRIELTSHYQGMQ